MFQFKCPEVVFCYRAKGIQIRPRWKLVTKQTKERVYTNICKELYLFNGNLLLDNIDNLWYLSFYTFFFIWCPVELSSDKSQ